VRAERDSMRRGCSGELEQAAAPSLIPTESNALLLHWRNMAAITLQHDPVDLDKLEFCVRRMRFWHDRIALEPE
jgi:hypothetical protein